MKAGSLCIRAEAILWLGCGEAYALDGLSYMQGDLERTPIGQAQMITPPRVYFASRRDVPAFALHFRGPDSNVGRILHALPATGLAAGQSNV